MQKITGHVQDTSKYLHYHWWQPVYYHDLDVPYPSQTKEKTGHWCGVADDYGDVLTYWVLTDDTKKLIPISDICPTHIRPNQHAQSAKSDSPLPGEPEHASNDTNPDNTTPKLESHDSRDEKESVQRQ